MVDEPRKKQPRVPKHVSEMDQAIAKLLQDVKKNQIVKKEYLQALELAIKWAGTRSRIINRKTAGSMFAGVGGEDPPGGGDGGSESDPGGETESDDDPPEGGDAGAEGT